MTSPRARRRSRRQRGLGRGQRGFTLVELTISITIVSIIAAAVCTSLVLAVQQGPTVQNRSTFAGDTAFLVDAITNDVANAKPDWPTPAASSPTCASDATMDLRVMPLFDGTSVAYNLVVDHDPTTTTDAGQSVYEVNVSRTPSNGTARVMLTAYCTAGNSMGTGAAFDEATSTYTLTLSLDASEGGDTRQIALSASRRTKLASSFTVGGSVYNDLDGSGTKNGAETGVSGVKVYLLSPDQTQLKYTLTTDANGAFTSSVDPGSYVVCQGLQSSWTATAPGASSGITTCAPDASLNLTTGSLGYVVTPAVTTSITFGTWSQFYGGSAPTCTNSPVPAALDTTTGNWPGNKGPDYWVYTNHGQSVQTAVDNAALADSATTGDINGDGYLIIQVVTHDDGSPSGNIAQAVTISATYPKKFALLGCGSTLTGGGAGPALWVKSSASAPTTTVSADTGGSANIYIGNLHGGNSATGVQIDGNGRYLRTVHATSNTSVGFAINGDSNTIYSGYAKLNTGPGVILAGNTNTITASFDAKGNTTYGVSISGSSNTLDSVDVGETGVDANGSDGVHVTGGSTTLNQVNVYANGGYGIFVQSNSNTLTNDNVGSSGKGNGNDGVHITGNSNTVSSAAVYANTGNGIWVSGNTNTLTSNTLGAHNKGNTADGIHVVGNSNSLTSNKADENGGDGFDISGGTTTANTLQSNTSASSQENVGAEYRLLDKITNNGSNKADGTTVPKTTAPTKCNQAGVQFPSGSSTFASVQACE